MSATQELIAAALRLTALAERNSDDGDKWQHAINSVREACARAMVQPAAPDMAEVERLVGEYGEQSWFDGRAERIDGGDFTRETRTALLDYLRGILAERDALIADNERLLEAYDREYASGGSVEDYDLARTALLDYVHGVMAERDQFRDAAKMAPVHCTPTEHDGRIVYEHTSEPIPNADGFVLYAAPAPDRFRAAAKMMAVQPACMTCSGHGMVGGLLPNGGGYQADPCPDCAAPVTAEVPMPERTGHFRNGKPRNEVCYCGKQMRDGQTCQTCGYTLHPQFMEVPMPDVAGELFDGKRVCDEADVRTYGDAREAAGYARGLAAGGKDVERLNFMDRNLKMRMGWSVGVALAGNVSIQSVISTRRPTSIRDAIDAALRGEVK